MNPDRIVRALRSQPFLQAILALATGLLIGAVLMAVLGYNPWKAYLALFEGALGNRYGIASTFSRATPLILTGLTFAIGVRAGLFNIGAQGQMTFGALVAVAAGTLPLPPGLHVLVALGFAMLAGAVWSLPAAYLKTSRGVHEVVSTIMLNWIGTWLATYLIITFLNDPVRGERSIQIASTARFPTVIFGSDLTYAILCSIAFAITTYWILWHMTPGFELRCSGFNIGASRYAGINPARSVRLAFILGGLAAGLAGATQVLGRHPYALDNRLDMLATLGFDGIAVALVGRNHPLGIIGAGLFFGALQAGAGLMAFRARVPIDMIRVVQGTIVLAIAAPEIWELVRRCLPLFRMQRVK